MANIFDQVMSVGKPATEAPPPGDEIAAPPVPEIAHPENPENPPPGEIVTAKQCSPHAFAIDRLKWSVIKGKFSRCDINPDLRAWMLEDSRIYNWIWTALAVVAANNKIDDPFPLPNDLEIMIPIPDEFREILGCDPDRCIIVTRKDKNVLSVAV